MENNILPFRGGELLRLYSIKITNNVSVSVALSSIAIERILDLFSLILLTGLLSLFIEIPHLLRDSIGFIVIFCFAVLSIMVYLANTSALNKYVNWIMPLSLLVLLNIGLMVPTLPASLGAYQFFTCYDVL